MAFHELLRVRSVKHVEQNAFDGGVSHRGFPGCVDCSPGEASATGVAGTAAPRQSMAPMQLKGLSFLSIFRRKLELSFHSPR